MNVSQKVNEVQICYFADGDLKDQIILANIRRAGQSLVLLVTNITSRNSI